MNLYNTRTKQIDPLAPIAGNTVTIYSCGPTVYDTVHIGNLSSFIYADTLRRVITAGRLKAKHVMNITDIDDKTIAASKLLYPQADAMSALSTLTEASYKSFLRDMVAAGNDVAALTITKATDHILDMQTLILELLAAGYAYATDDGVYFSIEKYKSSDKKYGQLLNLSESSTAAARIDNDEYDKASIHDFVLWKKQKSGEPSWPFEINGQQFAGRPGWHIECSAMSQYALQVPFDIHTGGIDLLFPHHENEIAQSTAIHGNIYASHFVHNEHLLIDGKKMSKSLNNFYTLKNITDKGYDPLAFRMLVLQSHYRNQAHFSWENLDAAQARLDELRALAALRFQALPVVHDSGTFALEDVPVQLLRILEEDLSTPQVFAYLSNVITQILVVLVEKDMLPHFVKLLEGLDVMLGFNLMGIQDISTAQKHIIIERTAARAARDWERSDELRDQLIAQGIGLRDTTEGTIWLPL